MRPKERRDSGQRDLFRARLDQIVDMSHPLAKLARTIDWGFLETRFGAVYADVPGRPPLATRLMAGLAILKHMHDLSDEALCDRWLENPYFQLFCGEEFFQHKVTFDRSSLTRWRQRMGEEKLAVLVQESLSVATRTGAAKPSDFSKVIVDTTVQEKAVAFPTNARLMHRAREALKNVSLSIRPGEVIGVVGRSGSGKSTLTKLIQRFYIPEEGQVLVDDVDVSQVSPAWLRAQIGVVLQENLLSNRSIHDNIALSNPSMSRAQAMAVARLAGADKFVSKLDASKNLANPQHF